ncbi:glycoside hydrolase family 2 protein [Pleurotus eryngii]|uniref:Beta-mannosidase B n=1 Tax=Pleurotus eryngii TaxID=5323 RepID=A0A9P5ZN71_PLEER|nr:glycoside hydrolase family 2 protein [Pleurotus eryngii]
MAMLNTVLDKGWFWKQRQDSIAEVVKELGHGLPDDSHDVSRGSIVGGWQPAVAFPSEVHVELLRSQWIPHPFVAFNEHKVHWIGEVEWLYYCTFERPRLEPGQCSELIFEGLDTVCDVYLNQCKIISADNMFRTYTYPLDDESATSSKQKTLLLHFKAAKKLAKAEEAKYGKVRAGSTNLGDPSRVYLRKAQYDWRYAAGPELMTCGPYRSIRIETYLARIQEVQPCITIHFPESSSSTFVARVSVNAVVQGDFNKDYAIVVSLKHLNGRTIRTARQEIPHKTEKLKKVSLKGIVDWSLNDNNIRLWWPVRYGTQSLYRLEVELVLLKTDEVIHQITKRIGFRSVSLVQEPLKEPDQYGTGSTFLFEINSVRMFIGGSNWVPADNFLTTITPERYRAWLTLLVKGNQNMVRLWGGGVYEPDVFYDICDELGILVWQDFQFACGVYPAHDEFVENVRKEAEDNVRRLRHHPSIALFCGNNEDYQQVLQWGGIDALPARKIYEEVLPAIVSALTEPPIPYHRGSPYGGKGWDTSDPTIGDVHQWNIWGGKELPYQNYDELGGRFVSEFGIPSMPSMKTIESWMDGASESDWHPQSIWMAQHTRAGSFERRFAILMNENFRMTSDFETFYTTQLMQSEATSYAYQSWRRKWRGKGMEYTAGALIWQLNDCWPVTSWAIVDYYLRPKPAYYTISRQLAEVAVGITRTVIQNRDHDRPRQFYEFGAIQSHGARIDIWGMSSSLQSIDAELELYCVDLNSGWFHKETRGVHLLPNQSTELISMPCPGPPKTSARKDADPYKVPEWTNSSSVVVSARLINSSTGEVLARHADWPQPLKYLRIPDPKLTVKVDAVKEELRVSVERPAKGVFFNIDGGGTESQEFGDGVLWSDNALDIMPGDHRIIKVSGLRNRRIYMAYLGKEKPSLVQ